MSCLLCRCTFGNTDAEPIFLDWYSGEPDTVGVTFGDLKTQFLTEDDALRLAMELLAGVSRLRKEKKL
jgi:hypothetical protein